MKHIKTLRIDIDKKNFEVIPSVQYDTNTRFLHIYLLNNSLAFDITGCSVKISGTKPDGTAIFNNCTVINAKEGFVEVELTEQMNAVPGTLNCELKLYSGNGVLTTKQFYIEVTASVTSKTITSANEFKALTEALKEVQRFEDRIDDLQNHITGGNMQQEHSHINKNILDKLGEDSDGTLMFNDKKINFDIDDNSFQGVKIKNETITPNKLSLDIISKESVSTDNLFNKNTAVEGFVASTTGIVTDNGVKENRASDFIEVKSNAEYERNPKGSISTANRSICFYDKNKTFISGTTYQIGEYQFTTPSNCKYIRFNFSVEHLDIEYIYSLENNNYYLNTNFIKDRSIPFEKISDNILDCIDNNSFTGEKIQDGSITPQKISNEIIEHVRINNIFNKDTVEVGYVARANGLVVSSSTNPSDRASDFIEVKPNTEYKRNPEGSISTAARSICFYDSDKTFISGISYQIGEYEFITPNNCKYIRINLAVEDLDIEYICLKGEEEKFSLNPNLLKDITINIKNLSNEIIEYVEGNNLFNKNTIEIGYVANNSGKLTVSANQSDRASDFIEVKENTEYKRNPEGSITSGNRSICFYDKDKVFISGKSYTIGDYKFTTPANCKYIRFNFAIEDLDIEYICLGSEEITSPGYKIVKDLLPTLNNENSNSTNIVNNRETDLIANKLFNTNCNTTKQEQGMISPDGTEHVMSVTNDGEFIAIPKCHFEMQSQSQYKFEVNGKSIVDDEIFVCGPGMKFIAVLNSKGYAKKYKSIPIGAYNFRKYTLDNGEIRYTVASKNGKATVSSNGGFHYNDLIIMKDDFTEIKKVALKAYGSVEEGFSMENHDYIYINDNHYIIPTYHPNIVSNIPGLDGKCKLMNCVIQEIKNNEVVFHWESIDHPELYSMSHFNNNYKTFTESQNIYTDYMHINSVVIDKRDNNLLISARHMGLFKINRSTGEIMWSIGKNKCDFEGLTSAMIPSMQHDTKYNYDNSITVFDNSGCSTDNVRICRYWLDEETMELKKFKEYITPYKRSPYMGGATLIDDELELFDIAYGGDIGTFPVAWHEYSFKHKKEYISYKNNDKKPFYRVFRNEKYETQE